MNQEIEIKHLEASGNKYLTNCTEVVVIHNHCSSELIVNMDHSM
jgi:hypothetical protein